MANPKPTPSPATQFKPGNAGGGRNPSKRKAGELCWDALFEDWQINGAEAIVAYRTANPGGYVQLVASGLPTEKEITVRTGELLSVEQAAEMAEAMIESAGRTTAGTSSAGPVRNSEPA